MRKSLSVLAASLLALLAVGLGASSAQAYPAPVFDVAVNHQVVVGGTPIQGHAEASVRCHDWDLTFIKQSASGAGKTIRHTFSTPVVTEKTVYTLHASCSYSVTAGAAGSALLVHAQSWTGQVPITLLPKKQGSGGQAADDNSSGAGLLPNTGGPAFWILVVAIVLLLGGGTAMVRARRHPGDTAA